MLGKKQCGVVASKGVARPRRVAGRREEGAWTFFVVCYFGYARSVICGISGNKSNWRAPRGPDWGTEIGNEICRRRVVAYHAARATRRGGARGAVASPVNNGIHC